MNIDEIAYQLDKYNFQGKKIFATSSFQTQSIALLHIISIIDKSIPIYFLNTGFLFPETLKYRDEIVNLLKLNLINLKPIVPKNLQKDLNGNLLFTSDPDFCCHLNKTQPLESVLAENDVWISGVRSNQNDNRKQLKVEGKAPHNVIRFHPILNWSDEMINNYIINHKLPLHPLENSGYHSIGCEPCTRKMDTNEKTKRDGRWFGLKKTECGLHTLLNIN